MTLRQKWVRKYKMQQLGEPAGDGETPVASVNCDMLEELQCPSLDDRRVKSSLTFFLHNSLGYSLLTKINI